MNRRSLLLIILRIAGALPVVTWLVGCQVSSDPPRGNPVPNSGQPESDSKTFSSTFSSGHDHSLTIACGALAAGSNRNITLTTSQDGGHSHSVVLTSAQLESVRRGSSVTVNTNGTHVHQFTISSC